MAGDNINVREDYTCEMRSRIIELQGQKNNQDVANGAGISYHQYIDLKRMNGNIPQRKTIKTELIHSLAAYYKVSYDYIRGISNNPHKDKKQNTIQSPFTFTNPEMLEKVYHEIQHLSQKDKDLIYQFFIFTKPTIRSAAFNFLRLIYDEWHQEAMASFLGQCSNMPGLRASLENGVHDSLYINALILLQDGESHVTKKRYRLALIKYLNVIQLIASEDINKKPELLSLGIAACNSIEAIENNWLSFPFTKDSKIMKCIRSLRTHNFAKNNRTDAYIKAVNEAIDELSKKTKRSEEDKKKLLQAFENSDKSYDEILNFMKGNAKRTETKD